MPSRPGPGLPGTVPVVWCCPDLEACPGDTLLCAGNNDGHYTVSWSEKMDVDVLYTTVGSGSAYCKYTAEPKSPFAIQTPDCKVFAAGHCVTSLPGRRQCMSVDESAGRRPGLCTGFAGTVPPILQGTNLPTHLSRPACCSHLLLTNLLSVSTCCLQPISRIAICYKVPPAHHTPTVRPASVASAGGCAGTCPGGIVESGNDQQQEACDGTICKVGSRAGP
jgi:hypothetical protein